MNWTAHAQRTARTPCIVVEVDLDYYEDEDIAATNDDGSLCYRTPATTSQVAVPEPTLTTKTRRWISNDTRAIPALGAAPNCVISAALAAEEIRIGRGLGFFGQATIVLQDFVDNDRREDPFYGDASRTGLDTSLSTYFRKLLARNPYLTGRPIRIIEGWATDGEWHSDDAITHNYFIREVQSPNGGRVKITAAGPLQLINLNAREAPVASSGRLLEDIGTADGPATFSDAIIADDYPLGGYVRIGEEIAAFTRSGVDLVLNRGHFGTTPEEHSEGDTIQLCLRYEATQITEIIEDLLITYGGVPEDLLDVDEWAEEQATWLGLYDLTATISQPTKVLELVQELLEASASICWWDDLTGKVRLRALRPASASLGTWADRFHLLGEVQCKTDITERVSRTDILIDLRSAALDAKDASSYRIRVVGVSDGEAVTEHGSPQIKLLATRWLSADQVALALRASTQVTAALRNGRQTFLCEVAAKDAGRNIGDVIELLTRDIVDRTGTPTRTRAYVVRREATAPGSKYRYLLELSPFTGRFAFYTAADCPDYDSASADDRDPGGFYGPADGSDFGPDDPAYLYG